MLIKMQSLREKEWQVLEDSQIKLFFSIAKIISSKTNLNLAHFMVKGTLAFQLQIV